MEKEMRDVANHLKWVVPHLFLHKKTYFIGAPHLLDGFLDIAENVGIEVLGAAISCAEDYHQESIVWPHEKPKEFFCEPDEKNQEYIIKRIYSEKADFVVSDSHMFFGMDIPTVEFGFPSFFAHAMYETPYLGIRGAAAFLGRVADCLYREKRKSWQSQCSPGFPGGRKPARKKND